MGKDSRGKHRGKCTICDCEEYENGGGIACAYCGDPPAKHELIAQVEHVTPSLSAEKAEQSTVHTPAEGSTPAGSTPAGAQANIPSSNSNDNSIQQDDGDSIDGDLDDPNESNAPKKNSKWKRVVAVGVVGGVAAIVAAPFAVPAALGAIGFGSGGIVGGSFAAGAMSSAATSGFGMGLVSVAQSIGATGLSAAGTTIAWGRAIYKKFQKH